MGGGAVYNNKNEDFQMKKAYTTQDLLVVVGQE